MLSIRYKKKQNNSVIRIENILPSSNFFQHSSIVITMPNTSKKGFVQLHGFTLVEVIVAASIMIILCVGILTVFSYVVKVNRGENLRAQALSVMQAEVEYYRGLKFVPGAERKSCRFRNGAA